MAFINKTMKTIAVFREVAGTWQRVDSREPNPPTLADYLRQMQIVIDDNCEFCRIKQYENDTLTTITYRAYTGGKVEITCTITQV